MGYINDVVFIRDIIEIEPLYSIWVNDHNKLRI